LTKDNRRANRELDKMAEPNDARVAVYIDFDNIVISQYDNIHGRSAFIKDKARNASGKSAARLDEAVVSIRALIDYASSFGAVAISRAYADWSAAANSRYRKQLVDRALDLVQLFPTSGTKNGADIRLSVDVVEDLFQFPGITHVVVVAGDSDYIPLAQNVRRLGRTVIAIGVAGSTSQAFKNSVDEFSYYADLPGAERAPVAETELAPDPVREASELLVRALGVGLKNDDIDDWMDASALKSQMKRISPAFDEKTLGHKSFTAFVRSLSKSVELKEDGLKRQVRLQDRSAH
jgi:uncharacterized LabA/DUF88 family protein